MTSRLSAYIGRGSGMSLCTLCASSSKQRNRWWWKRAPKKRGLTVHSSMRWWRKQKKKKRNFNDDWKRAKQRKDVLGHRPCILTWNQMKLVSSHQTNRLWTTRTRDRLAKKIFFENAWKNHGRCKREQRGYASDIETKTVVTRVRFEQNSYEP